MIYYKHFIGDYQRKTNRLSILEDGVYRRLLDEYYANESPLPLENDACFRLVRAIKLDERRAVLKILSMYFTKRPDGYIQGRADEEIIVFKEKSGKASRAARKRWDANASANASANADARKPCERNAIPDTIAKSYSQTPNPKSKKTPPYPPNGGKLEGELPPDLTQLVLTQWQSLFTEPLNILEAEKWADLIICQLPDGKGASGIKDFMVRIKAGGYKKPKAYAATVLRNGGLEDFLAKPAPKTPEQRLAEIEEISRSMKDDH